VKLATPRGRITVLDGWRGVSILLVIYGHLVNYRYWGDAPITLSYRFADVLATLGVDIFFVISGFIITTLALREREASGRFSPTDFYIRRVLRIIPPYFLYLACILLLSACGAIVQQTSQTLTGAAFACNLPQADCGYFAGHSWSLAYEEQYYVVFPLVFVCLGSSIGTALGVLLIALLGWPLIRYALSLGHVWILIGHATFFVSFICIGAFMAVCAGRMRQLATSRYAVYACWLAALILASLVWLDVLSHARPDIPPLGKLRALLVPTLEPLCIAWLLGGSVYGENWATRMLNAAPLQFLGMISYSLYLWQEPFSRSPSAYPGAPWLKFTPLMVVCATLSYYFIERPCIRLGKRIIAMRRA
jgi:peptidoglycan/LPS O-acetylase OafA/YrhL